MPLATIKRLLSFPNPHRGFSQAFDLRQIPRNNSGFSDLGKLTFDLPAIPGHVNEEQFVSFTLAASEEGNEFFPVPDRRRNFVRVEIPGQIGGLAGGKIIELPIPADVPRFIRVECQSPAGVKVADVEINLTLSNDDFSSILKSTDSVEQLRSDYEARRAVLEVEADACAKFVTLKDRLAEAQRENEFLKAQIQGWPDDISMDAAASIIMGDFRQMEKVGTQLAARAAIRENSADIIKAIETKTIGEAAQNLKTFTEQHRATLKKHSLL